MPRSKNDASFAVRGRIERDLCDQGFILAGVDEVGRGCIAGPVVTGCVVLDYSKVNALDRNTRYELRDSKTLSSAQRQRMLTVISNISVDQAIGMATEREIEDLGIAPATFLAMRRAIASLSNVRPTLVLVDGSQKITSLDIRQQTVVKGDNLCFAIAAAAILAKEYRDQLMRVHHDTFPQWGFGRHVGYGTAEHLDAITNYGVCALHRRNFAPIRNLVNR